MGKLCTLFRNSRKKQGKDVQNLSTPLCTQGNNVHGLSAVLSVSQCCIWFLPLLNPDVTPPRRSIISVDVKMAAFNGIIPNGQHEFPFSAKIPPAVPSSFNIRKGRDTCAVQYVVQAIVSGDLYVPRTAAESATSQAHRGTQTSTARCIYLFAVFMTWVAVRFGRRTATSRRCLGSPQSTSVCCHVRPHGT